jgi:hypothetical protein
MPPGTISERMIGLLPFHSKIQGDTRACLRTATEHVPGSGPLKRLRVIDERSVNQTGHAGMTDSNPARPSERNEYGTVLPSVTLEIGLRIAFDIESTRHSAPINWRFPD